MEKVHNFLAPPPLEYFGLFWIWEKIDFRWPSPGPKLGKIWNVDFFDIVPPPLTLAKTVPKSFQTDTWGLFYSYIGHKCTKCCIYLTNISPIYHKNQGHISVIWIWEKCEKFRPPPLKSKLVYIWLYWFCRWPLPPPFGTFSTIWDIFSLEGSPKVKQM